MATVSTLCVVLGCILGYLTLGLLWARSQAVRIQLEVNVWSEKLRKLPTDRHGFISRAASNVGRPWYAPHGMNLEQRAFRHGIGHQAAWWPVFSVVGLWSAALSWAAKPVSKQRERVGCLRARADEMAAMVEALPSDEDKRILEAFIKENRRLAKELEI